MKITLSPTEVEIAHLVGRRRRDISLLYGRNNTRHDFTPSGIDNDIEAVAAEMCVAKALNVYPEWSPTEGEVPRFDLKWKDHPINVKSTQYPNGNLLIPDLLESSLYFLVRGKLPHYDIAGYIPGDQVKLKGEYLKQTYRPCWTIKTGQLYSLDILLLVGI
jgi:hypothetical protein